jgi:exo-beta-1,3-glucanase (GH17 family)
MRSLLAALLSFFIAAPALGAPVCATRDEAAPALSRLQAAMEKGRFVAYQPTELKVWNGNPVQASEVSIREDLKALRPWFDGVITYGAHSGAELIPGIAKELGYRAVVMGIWNPDDDREVRNALAVWEKYPDIVLGVSLGNEMVLSRRGSWSGYARAIGKFRDRAPKLPLAVTEPFATFLDDPGAKPVLAKLDFMAVNIHPIFEPWFKDVPPFNWADFVVQASKRLSQEAFCGPVLIKETGVPTAPEAEGFTPEKQKAFYAELARQLPPSRGLAFAYFSAFDAPWRVYDESAVAGTHPEEAHWGLFTETREPKPVMQAVPKL